jgi:hypothetical protein
MVLQLGTLWNVGYKYLERFDMWCGRRLEKIGWTDNVRNFGVLRTVKEEGNIIQSLKRRKVKRIGYIFCENCLVKHDIEGKIEGRI